ncbi:MAG: glycosyltransferase family 39 protein [Nitrospinota bacterium]|nr:glycosyltransferase family 39 protein [Nitrospinota bacterium]
MPSLPVFLSNKPIESFIVCFWMGFCFLALSYQLGEVPPYHADENFYVESSLRMIESGDFITPVYNEKKRFAKPIMYYWMVATSYKIFGVSLASARFPSLLFGTLSIGLTFLLACRLFNSRVGLLSAFILPSIYLHFQISRWSTTDMALSFFILLALYLFVLWFETGFKKNIFSYLFYFAIGLGFMVKGPPAILIPGFTVVGFLIATKRKSCFKDLSITKGLGILAITILPWFVAMLWIHGDEFKNHIVGNEIKNRLVHDTPFSFYYLGVLFRYQLPWSLFFFFAVLRQFGFIGFVSEKKISWVENFKSFGKNIGKHVNLFFREGRESLVFCYIWLAVCLVLFTFLRVEHSRYMLPCCPVFAILTAKFFSDAEKSPIKSGVLGFKGPHFISFLILLILSIFGAVGVFIYGTGPVGIFLMPLILLIGAISFIWFFRFKSYGKMVFSLSLSMVLTFSFLSGDVLPFVNRYPMKKFSNYINQEKFKGPIAVYKLGNNRARLGVLTGRTVVTLYSRIEVEKFLRTNQKIYLVVKQSDLEKEISNLEMKIVEDDQIRIKINFTGNKIMNLFDIGKLRQKLNSTENLYLMSNK